MDELPLALLLRITEDSVETWKALVLSVPIVGRYSLNPEYQRRFTQCIEYNPDKYGIIREHKLCNELHNVDGPAVEHKSGTKAW